MLLSESLTELPHPINKLLKMKRLCRAHSNLLSKKRRKVHRERVYRGSATFFRIQTQLRYENQLYCCFRRQSQQVLL